MTHQVDSQSMSLGTYEQAVRTRAGTLFDYPERFWRKDPSLWGSHSASAGQWLGWVDAYAKMDARVTEIESFARAAIGDGFERVVLCGMGGSSLAPLVISSVFGEGLPGLPLEVLDSTDPETVLRIEREAPLGKTLFVISSKSGTTAEPSAFDDYFFDKVGSPENFVAITDPNSPFAGSATERGFRRVFLNFADIGGRYSALSYFGLVPAALMGVDLRKLLARTKLLMDANLGWGPAFELGAALGELATSGRDKLTFLTIDRLSSLGLWLEQLLAESTGKEGKGILPVAGEEPGPPSVYGKDRVFVELRLQGENPVSVGVHAAALRDAGHPVIEIELQDPYDLGQEFLRWEIATAVVGTILGIDPFDQPNVQESKDITKRLLKELDEKGSLPDERPCFTKGDVELYGEECGDSIAEAFTQFLRNSVSGEYICLQAYLPESKTLTAELHKLQALLRNDTHLATTMGYGPRFLHSTGQFHKGGPATGYFIQLTHAPSEDAPIPGQRATWAQFIDAQARGDLEALRSKGRRTLRVHFKGDVLAGLSELTKLVERGLSAR